MNILLQTIIFSRQRDLLRYDKGRCCVGTKPCLFFHNRNPLLCCLRGEAEN